MIVCEQGLENAIRVFFGEVKIPRPSGWSRVLDEALLKATVPAFLSALEEIEAVDYCYGFDKTKVFD